LYLTLLVDFRFGNGEVTPEPEKLEPGPVALYHGLDKLEDTICGITIFQSQLRSWCVAIVAKAIERMETVLGKMTIVCTPSCLPGTGPRWNPSR
jgi:hypothetical protein